MLTLYVVVDNADGVSSPQVFGTWTDREAAQEWVDENFGDHAYVCEIEDPGVAEFPEGSGVAR